MTSQGAIRLDKVNPQKNGAKINKTITLGSADIIKQPVSGPPPLFCNAITKDVRVQGSDADPSLRPPKRRPSIHPNSASLCSREQLTDFASHSHHVDAGPDRLLKEKSDQVERPSEDNRSQGLSKTQFMDKCDVGPLTYYELALFNDNTAQNQNASAQALIETEQLSLNVSIIDKVKSVLFSARGNLIIVWSYAKQNLKPALWKLTIQTKKTTLLFYDNTADFVEKAYRTLRNRISNSRQRDR